MTIASSPSWQVIVMAAVAALLSVVGAWLLAALVRTSAPARVYVYRMVGIMALSAGVVLGFSAYAMWQWSVP